MVGKVLHMSHTEITHVVHPLIHQRSLIDRDVEIIVVQRARRLREIDVLLARREEKIDVLLVQGLHFHQLTLETEAIRQQDLRLPLKEVGETQKKKCIQTQRQIVIQGLNLFCLFLFSNSPIRKVTDTERRMITRLGSVFGKRAAIHNSFSWPLSSFLNL